MAKKRCSSLTSNAAPIQRISSSLAGAELVPWCLFFVLETIRTSAMRVIHIIVKTEETQKLSIVFVLYCAT